MMHFLMKVNDSFQQVRTNILMMEQPPTISQAYRLLLQEQRHKELTHLSTPLPDPMAFVSDRKNTSHRNSSSKPSNQSTVSGNKRTSRYYCDHCKIGGHSLERCFKIHGYPNSSKPRKRLAASVHSSVLPDDASIEHTGLTTLQFNNLLSLLGKHKPPIPDDASPSDSPVLTNNHHLAGISCFFSSFDSSIWIIDSGATDHMCHSLSSLINLKNLPNRHHKVTVPDGRQVPVTMIGDMPLSDHIMLTNVLYVPQFHYNLISVQRLCVDNGVTLRFSHSHCFVQAPSMSEPMVLGSLYQGLYCTSPSSHVAASNSHATVARTSNLSTETPMLWHLRLGHASMRTLKLLRPHLDLKHFKNNVICTVCPQAKQTRLPFSSSTIKSSSPFQLLHLDVWGPYSHKTHNNCSYFLTIVDDFTRCTWIFLMKHKSDSVIHLTHFS